MQWQVEREDNMKVYQASEAKQMFEHLIKDEKLNVVNIRLNAGESIGKHKAPQHVVVVIVKGKVLFSDETFGEEIYPGKIIYMQPNEIHELSALEDSELMVIKIN